MVKMAKKKVAGKKSRKGKTVSAKARKFRLSAAKRRSKLLPAGRHGAPKKSFIKPKKGAQLKLSPLSPKLLKKAQEQEKKAEALMASGRQRGFVTYDEILKSFPTIESDVTFLEELYEKFATAGIDVLEGGGMLNMDDEQLVEKGYSRSDSQYDSIQMYLREIGKYPLLNAQSERDLAKRITEGDSEARNLLARARTSASSSLSPKNMSAARPTLPCLTSSKKETSASLRPSINLTTPRATNFRPTRRGGYARLSPARSPTRAAPSASRCTWSRLSPNTSKCRAASARTSAATRLAEEIALEMGIDVEKIYQIEKIDQDTVSLESPVGDDDGDGKSTLGDFIKDDKILSPDQEVARRILADQLREILDELSPKEREILKLRHGLEDGIYHTLEEVGKKFGVTRERIRQIEAKALERIRTHEKAKAPAELLKKSPPSFMIWGGVCFAGAFSTIRKYR